VRGSSESGNNGVLSRGPGLISENWEVGVTGGGDLSRNGNRRRQ
jgi:hypothetical protein